jgi:hypothetical protein
MITLVLDASMLERALDPQPLWTEFVADEEDVVDNGRLPCAILVNVAGREVRCADSRKIYAGGWIGQRWLNARERVSVVVHFSL